MYNKPTLLQVNVTLTDLENTYMLTNVFSRLEDNDYIITRYCMGKDDKEQFIDHVRSLYPNNYVGFSVYVMPASDSLIKAISSSL
jgi:hypothetical protein